MVNDLKPKLPKTEGEDKMRQQFLNFVRDTTVAAEPGTKLPDFEKIWQSVFLGQ
jgi:hypothetical protein